MNPGDWPSLKDIRACIEKKKDKKQLTTQLELSEAIVLEIYDRSNGTGATEIKNQLPKYDGTVASIFICLKIHENI